VPLFSTTSSTPAPLEVAAGWLRSKSPAGSGKGALTSSLEFRLLVPLVVIVCGILAVYSYLSFRASRDRFLELVGGHADRSSGLIRRATHDGMLLNRLDEVQVTIERLAEGTEVAAIRVYDKEGRIVLSSDRAEIGRRTAVDVPPCAICHVGDQPASLTSVQVADVARSGGEEEVLRQLSVIENEPSCSAGGCHDRSAGESVLGVLDVEMSMLPLSEALAAARQQLIWTTLVLVLVIGGAAAVIIRRLIRHPIARLQEGTRRIAEGDLETRIEVKGGHELARLAQDFNRMAADLSRTQQELTEWSLKLEDKVVEKTAELRDAQRQVLHMEKMASLGKLSATVAHEINNPLSGVITYARLVERELEEQPLGAEVREELTRYLRLVQQESGRCSQIVNNLLVFARRSATELTSVDVNEVVERSLMLIRHHLEISGVEPHTDLLAGDSRMVADAGQLQQALVALFVNAVEAMPDGGRLTIRLEGNEAEVRIEIADTGVGIAPEVLPLIFEPFFSTKQGESGVGLGLAVVYGIIHRHGGRIDVESRVGEGATFKLRLPRTPPPGPDGQVAMAEAASASAAAPSRPGR
jgi:two-component system NtrC family sensor kinase